jgi:hypothetical protein
VPEALSSAGLAFGSGSCGWLWHHTRTVARIWLIVTFALVAIASPAGAQVFKPRGKAGSSAKAAPKKAPAEASAKKQPAARKAESPSRVAAKTKKSRAADQARPSDLTPEESPKKGKAGKAKAGKGRAKPADEDESSGSDIGDDEVIITDDDD